MYICGNKYFYFLKITQESDFSNINPEFLKSDLNKTISGEINDKSFFNKFLKYFKSVQQLHVFAYGSAMNYNFLYQMPQLEDLRLTIIYDLDLGKLTTSLKKLDFVWDENKIVFSQDNHSIQNLSIKNFNDKDCSRLLHFKNVKELFLETEKKCKSLSHIEELKQLEYLTVIAKHESIQGIQKLDNLINLGLCDFKIQNLNELKQLKNLKTLFISIKSLNDISALSGLENLEAITFDGCWSMEDFSPLKKLKKLRFLEITDSKKLQSIEFVKQLTNLEQLTLYGTTIIIDNNLQPANHIPRVYVQKYLKTYNLNITDKAPKGERKRIHNFM